MTTRDDAPLALYGFWRTSATYRVRVALHLKNIRVQEHIVDLDAAEQRSDAYLAINPLGGIPALLAPGHPPMTQSLAILEYLEELQPTPPLLPSDLPGRVRVRSLAGMLATDTHPLITPRVRKYLASTCAVDAAAWRAWQEQWFSTGLLAVEQRLARESETGLFCHGDAPGMADICLASIVAIMGALGIGVAPTPTIDRIVARCQTLDAFARADFLRQTGAPA